MSLNMLVKSSDGSIYYPINDNLQDIDSQEVNSQGGDYMDYHLEEFERASEFLTYENLSQSSVNDQQTVFDPYRQDFENLDQRYLNSLTELRRMQAQIEFLKMVHAQHLSDLDGPETDPLPEAFDTDYEEPDFLASSPTLESEDDVARLLSIPTSEGFFSQPDWLMLGCTTSDEAHTMKGKGKGKEQPLEKGKGKARPKPYDTLHRHAHSEPRASRFGRSIPGYENFFGEMLDGPSYVALGVASGSGIYHD